MVNQAPTPLRGRFVSPPTAAAKTSRLAAGQRDGGYRPSSRVEKAAASAGLMWSVPGRRLVNVDDLPDTVPSDEYPGLVVAPDGRSLGGCPGNEQRVGAHGANSQDPFSVSCPI